MLFEIDSFGTKSWHNENGEPHREDGPAIEWFTGDKCWAQRGELHRENGPAIEYTDGGKVWYQHGKLHREDGAAIEWSNGHKQWWYKGKQLTPCVQTVEQLKSYIRNKILW